MNYHNYIQKLSVSRIWKISVTALICFLTVLSVQAQTRLVRGTVLDPDSEPVIGATVKVKGTTKAVATDVDGKFAIEAAPNATITMHILIM